MPTGIERRDVQSLTLLLLSIALFWTPLSALARLSLNDGNYSYIVAIPLISCGLFYVKRAEIFSQRQQHGAIGWVVLLLAVTMYALASNRLFLQALAIVLVWVAIFTLCYGTLALRSAAFPLGFLAFMIPIPQVVLNSIVGVLQSGSADLTAVLFRTLGIPSFRQGFRFLLPGIEIEIANECSGIRSTLSLCIASVLAGNILLRYNSRRILFILAAIPIAILKNAVRIVTLSYLGIYVDPAFLTGKLHHQYGGLVFSFLSLALFIPLLLLLRRSEVKKSPAPILVT